MLSTQRMCSTCYALIGTAVCMLGLGWVGCARRFRQSQAVLSGTHIGQGNARGGGAEHAVAVLGRQRDGQHRVAQARRAGRDRDGRGRPRTRARARSWAAGGRVHPDRACQVAGREPEKEWTTKSFAQALQATATVALSIVLLASNLVSLPRVPLPKVIQ